MKRKNIESKLVLNKKTISNLSMSDMVMVMGGELTDECLPTATTCHQMCQPSTVAQETHTGGTWLPCMSAGDDCGGYTVSV